MQDHIDNFKRKRIFKLIIGFILILVIVLLFFAITFSGEIKTDKISSINIKAQTQYKIFEEYTDDILKELNVPEKGTYYITGECYDCEYYLAYAGDILEHDTVVYGNIQDEINGYWAIRIDNGVVTESWFSNYKLNEDQLRPYSIKEQKKQMHLFDKLSKTRMIGYYSVE